MRRYVRDIIVGHGEERRGEEMLNEMKSNVFIGLLHDILAEPKSLNHVSRLLYAILTSSEILEAQPFQSRYLKNIFES